MTGVSFMLPFVVAGGLLIALAFALGGIHANDAAAKGTLAYALFEIGGKGGFVLMVPLARYRMRGPSASIKPKPVQRNPGSTPSTRMVHQAGASSARPRGAWRMSSKVTTS